MVSLMVVVGSHMFYTALNISLDKSAKFKGQIQEINIFKSRPSVSRFGTVQRNILGIKMNGLQGLFSVYNPQQNYTQYLNQLRIGDTITIHYSHKVETYDTELYQIIKGEETILRLKQYTHRQLFIGLLSLTVGLLIAWRITRKVYLRSKPTNKTIINNQ
jgi:hypothetical protein